MGVFGEPTVARVVDANDDQRLDVTGLDAGVRAFAHLPRPPLNIRSASVKEILTIMQVQDGIVALRAACIARWDVDDEITSIRQEAACEALMYMKSGVRSRPCRERYRCLATCYSL